jgi:hypothetical protein
MRIANVGGPVKLLVAAEALEIDDAASDGPFSADPRNTHEHFAALPDLATREYAF